MLDAAVKMFSINGYYETSMDAIAAQAEISKPMLYLYYGSKEELFGACLDRELTRFVDTVRAEIDFTQSPKELLRNAVLSFLNYIDANRASWIVLYTQATSSQAFAHTVREGRDRIIDLVGRLLQSGTRNPEPDTDFDMRRPPCSTVRMRSARSTAWIICAPSKQVLLHPKHKRMVQITFGIIE